MSAVDTIVFDLGNVVIQWDPLNLYRKLIPDFDELDAFLRDVDIHALNGELDRGFDPVPTVAEWANRHPRWSDAIGVYWERWPETLGPVDVQTASIVDDLKRRGHRVFALSNWGSLSFRRKPSHPVFDAFDGVMISGDVGVNKPEPEIYRRAEEQFNLVPSSTLFVDDRDENVDAAVERGWHGHVFVDALTLTDELRALGLRG